MKKIKITSNLLLIMAAQPVRISVALHCIWNRPKGLPFTIFSRQICLLQCVSVLVVEVTWPEHGYDVVFVAVILRLCVLMSQVWRKLKWDTYTPKGHWEYLLANVHTYFNSYTSCHLQETLPVRRNALCREDSVSVTNRGSILFYAFETRLGYQQCGI